MRMMKRFSLAFVAAMSLAACSPAIIQNVPESPGAIAPANVLDERIGLTVETAYTAASRGAALAIRFGVVKDVETIKKIGALDIRAKRAVDQTRLAYRARNAASYAQSYEIANALVKDLLASY